MVSADSHYILPAAWSGSSGPCGRRYSWDWPRPPPVHDLDWTSWRAALVCTFGVEPRSRRKHRALGSWYSTGSFGSCALYSKRFNRVYCPVLDSPMDSIPTRWRVYQERPRSPQFVSCDRLIGFASVCLASPLHVADITSRLNQPVFDQHCVSLCSYHASPLDIPLSPPSRPPPVPSSVVCQDLPISAHHWFLAPTSVLRTPCWLHYNEAHLKPFLMARQEQGSTGHVRGAFPRMRISWKLCLQESAFLAPTQVSTHSGANYMGFSISLCSSAA